ncbi:cell elongation-specific peptidoglycan biosynthesis regulator RodA [Herbihabitans rhizosphaerae]|uniref:Cell elongation-specific peptidoglycan biosynthesis regulator RodA n=1 Tax=Herbihabitans rhizosphaerae TaxID=1872711 RepID=A0A4Q7KMJ9_9PSEU|nr:FtsW/RodA/SpoVE family cell cycle protein [Herbihabitans rhizosphaerae]RZS37536.1 cell elongation-specific peptidoglycan biosynthesis regulator RodA [Herbihabitans rhizosphaerae]
MAQPVSGDSAGQQPNPGAGHGATTPEAPTRRGTELVMLAFAALLVTGALMLVEANQEQQLTARIVYYGLAYLALFAVAHVAVRRFAPYADPLILPCVALLNGLGLVMIYRLDLAYDERAIQTGRDIEDAVPKQIMWTALALVLFLVVLTVVKDHRTLTKYGYTFGLVGLGLLALPAVLPAEFSEVNGAKVWVRLGSLSIQPGEFAKILLMVFFASFLVAKRDLFMAAGRRVLGIDLPRARDLGPILVAWAVSIAVLVAEKDLGSSLLFFGIVLVMLYVATERAVWVVAGLTLFAGGAFVAWSLFDHVRTRVDVWLDPFADYEHGGFQIAQGLFGFATGGVGGTGLGAGRPDVVPYANSDFITAAIGEELGFIGLAALLLVYTVLAMRGMRSALAVRDTFGKLLGGGLSFALIMQVFVVVGGVTKLIPLTGITAPFMSAGGSSLLANYILVALLLRISDAARRPTSSGGSKPRVAPKTPIAEAHTVMVERPS